MTQTQTKIRTGDLVRFPRMEGGGAIESMVVYADYATGWLGPACAGDAWEVEISACEVVALATDAVHSGVLEGFAAAVESGEMFKGARRALEIHRPDFFETRAKTRFMDLAIKAGADASHAALRTARLGGPTMTPGIALAAAQYMLQVACACFATSIGAASGQIQPGDVTPGTKLDDDRTLAVWRAVMLAWSHMPDADKAESVLAGELGKLGEVEFVHSGSMKAAAHDQG